MREYAGFAVLIGHTLSPCDEEENTDYEYIV